jgi:hypothetical protein
VDITLDAGGIGSAECTCPYDWGGICKHIVAVLLAYINRPDQVEERPSLDTLLAALSAEQLRTILTSLAEFQPGFVDVIEAKVTAIQARGTTEQARTQSADKTSSAVSTGPKTARKRHTAVDPASFRSQVHSILHSLDRMRMSKVYWHVGGIVQSVRQVAAFPHVPLVMFDVALFSFSLLFTPVAIGVAILRYRSTCVDIRVNNETALHISFSQHPKHLPPIRIDVTLISKSASIN